MQVEGNIVDVINKRIFPGIITISENKISDITESKKIYDNYIIPGFIDSHIHIESSMLSPLEFSKQVIRHGTVAVVSDPHEIANVCGLEGIKFMIDNGKSSPLKIFYGVPSCVPATAFENSGFTINSKIIEELLNDKDIYYLSEMMNFPGVIYNDDEVKRKLNIAKKLNKQIDGHAPGIRGENLEKYINAGITTDHECFSIDEAEEKIQKGMKILIRDGSAAKNFTELYPLIDKYPNMVMLCSDDKHPEDLINSHINRLVTKAISLGCDIYNVLRAVSLNPIQHYNLPVGLIRKNDYADFIVVNNLVNFEIQETYIDGNRVFEKKSGLDAEYFKFNTQIINNFEREKIELNEIEIEIPKTTKLMNIIECIDGELITKRLSINTENLSINDVIKAERLNKIVVINRYEKKSKPIIGYIKGFSLQDCAISSTIAHDCHNIIAVGDNDQCLLNCINNIITLRGGISFCDGTNSKILPLEIGGIMTNRPIEIVASEHKYIENIVKDNGCTLKSPFMTLSFMALLVIPELKIGDKGLFDIRTLEFVNLFD